MFIVLKYLTKLTKTKANILKMKTMTDNDDFEHLRKLFEQELTVTFNKTGKQILRVAPFSKLCRIHLFIYLTFELEILLEKPD